MEWGNDRREAIAQLRAKVRITGSFVDRAVVRELKIASERFPEHDLVWREVETLVQRWEEGMPDRDVIEAIRQLNGTASFWRDKSAVRL